MVSSSYWKLHLAWLLLTVPNVGFSQSGIVLTDSTASSGIEFEHFSGRSGKHWLYETISTGIATLDYDGDGLIDVYLPNGGALPGQPDNPDHRNHLFRNLGDGKFVDVTDVSGAGDMGFAMGATAGDFDNDGDQDLFVSNYGPNVMLENYGDGTFVRREIFASEENPRMGTGIALLDFDSDGALDLFVTNYVRFDPTKIVNRSFFGVPAAAGPLDYEPDVDTLLRNSGDGQFVDVSDASGITTFAGPGMGIVAYDFDGDFDIDIFVCNDTWPNHLYENLGDGTFDEIALLASVAYDVTGGHQASMGVDVGDFDRDGLLDMVTTNFSEETPTMYQYSGDGYFDEIGSTLGLAVADRRVTWGVGFGDFDNDKYLDLYIAAGHLFQITAGLYDVDEFRMPNIIMRGNGRRFLDQSAENPAVRDKRQVTRGIAIDDLDNDGDLDLVGLNSDDTAQLLTNDSQLLGSAWQIMLVGTTVNRDGVGAHVTLVDDQGMRQSTVVVSGRGYQSHFGTRLHFGLGKGKPVSLEVRWPNGKQQTFDAPPVGDRWLCIENSEDLIPITFDQ